MRSNARSRHLNRQRCRCREHQHRLAAIILFAAFATTILRYRHARRQISSAAKAPPPPPRPHATWEPTTFLTVQPTLTRQGLPTRLLPTHPPPPRPHAHAIWEPTLPTHPHPLRVQAPSATKIKHGSRIAHSRPPTLRPRNVTTLCQRYGFAVAALKSPRRIFWGTLIADESRVVRRAVAEEVQGLVHRHVFVEANFTPTFAPRRLRYAEPGAPERAWLLTHFENASVLRLGPSDMPRTNAEGGYVDMDMRDHITPEWARLGMRADDVGVVSDMDEVFSRDFIFALRECDVPQLRPRQDCRRPKIVARAAVFEGSPRCGWCHRRWYHPDALLGECIRDVSTLNPAIHFRQTDEEARLEERAALEWNGTCDGVARLTGWRHMKTWGTADQPARDWILKHCSPSQMMTNTETLRRVAGRTGLWTAADFRMRPGNGADKMKMKMNNKKQVTGFHLHNFFESLDAIRSKHKTYSHPDAEALTKAIGNISKDLRFMIRCVMPHSRGPAALLVGDDREASDVEFVYRTKENLHCPGREPPLPRLFQDAEIAQRRHAEVESMVERAGKEGVLWAASSGNN